MALSKEIIEKYTKKFEDFAKENNFHFDSQGMMHSLIGMFENLDPIPDEEHREEKMLFAREMRNDEKIMKNYNAFYITSFRTGLGSRGVDIMNRKAKSPEIDFETIKNYENLMRDVFKDIFYPAMRGQRTLKDYRFGNLGDSQIESLKGYYDKYTEVNYYKKVEASKEMTKNVPYWEKGRMFLEVNPANASMFNKQDWLTHAAVQYKAVAESYNSKWLWRKWLTKEGWKERHTMQHLETAIEAVRDDKTRTFARFISDYADATIVQTTEYVAAIDALDDMKKESAELDETEPDNDLLNHPKDAAKDLYSLDEEEINTVPERQNIILEEEEEDKKEIIDEINTDTKEEEKVIGMSEKDN